MKSLHVALLLTILSGCATTAGVDRLCFDRGAFALGYGGLSSKIKADCAKAPDNTSCAKFDVLDDQVTKAIMAPPPPPAPSPLDALLPLLLQLAPLAAGL